MLLNFLPERKKKSLLIYAFISDAAKRYSTSTLKGKYLTEFLETLYLFKKQLVPKILSEDEYNTLISICLRKSTERGAIFERIWNERWKIVGGKGTFQTEKNESPFAEYSSKGWKIHIAFQKGRGKEVAKFLYEHGLYFKVESGIGTYFNGTISSGATIYIGSHNNMQIVANLIEKGIGKYLVQGAYAIVKGRRISIGSGSDIEVKPNIMARFDVAKTRYGWFSGNKKYSEHGLPTWTGLGGTPILKKYEANIPDALEKWNSLKDAQRQIYLNKLFKRVYDESRQDLIKDFGQEFVFGK